MTSSGKGGDACASGPRNVEKGSARWRERRWRRLRDLAPGWAGKGTKAAAERLITQAVAGNAWCAVHAVTGIGLNPQLIC